MESYVPQLVQIRGEMWRTFALLQMGFYTGAHANDQAEPSSYLTQRGRKKQTVVQSSVNDVVISPRAVAT